MVSNHSSLHSFIIHAGIDSSEQDAPDADDTIFSKYNIDTADNVAKLIADLSVSSSGKYGGT